MNNEKLLELASLKACGRHSWREIGRYLGITWQAARSQWRRNCRDIEPGPCPICGESAAPNKGDARSSWQEQGNYAEGTAQQAGDPLSLDEFLDLLRVDTDVWRVRDWKASRWQSPINRRGHLDFDKGVLDGSLDYFPGVQDLWSHRATFVRYEPIAIRPVVQPVECPVTYTQRPKDWVPVLGQALLISDLHIGYERDNRTGKLRPFHDRRAIGTILDVLAAVRFDRIYILGDLLDLTNWNDKFARSPEFFWTTQPAILETHWLLRQIRELKPRAEITLLSGNHEERIRKMLQRHLLEACDLKAADEMHLPPALSPQKLLALGKLGIEWADDERWMGSLRLSHGEVARKPPGASARAVVEDSQCDNAFGHTHRLEMVSKVVRIWGGSKVVKSLSTGCLCHTDGRVPGSSKGDNWQPGFVTVTYTEDLWTPALVSLHNGRGVLGGNEYKGKDYVDALRQDLPDWNW